MVDGWIGAARGTVMELKDAHLSASNWFYNQKALTPEEERLDKLKLQFREEMVHLDRETHKKYTEAMEQRTKELEVTRDEYCDDLEDRIRKLENHLEEEVRNQDGTLKDTLGEAKKDVLMKKGRGRPKKKCETVEQIQTNFADLMFNMDMGYR